jgi:tetratricopeptide (TPR) repeat protein
MDSPAPTEPELIEELDRLKGKLAFTNDPDIRNALQSRVAEVEKLLSEHSANIGQAAVTESAASLAAEANAESPTKTEAQMRRELATLSRQLYSEDDPTKRAALQALIGGLQSALGIDVARIAEGELIPDPLPAPKGKAPDKANRTTMADLEAALMMQKAKIQASAKNESLGFLLPDLPSGPVEPDAPDKVEAAERLIQQARVEQMRNNAVRVRELLEEAQRTAPNSPGVLEMLGDDYSQRKQYSKAIAAYKRAVTIDPKNVQVERKLATVALNLEGSAGMTPMDDSAIPMASRNAALLISILLPGLGHIVAGQTKKGILILSAWCICLAWTILMGADIAKLGSTLTGGRQHANYLVLIPVLGMLGLFIATLADFKKPVETYRKPVDRPAPPVNLPFE